MISIEDSSDERIAAASPELANGAEVPPPPLPLIERVRIACEDRRGDHGGDLLLLGARLDAFLQRPATPEEIGAYITAAGVICGEREALESLYAGTRMLVTDGDSVEFVTVGSAAAESYREELLASGNGYVDFGASRSWMPLGPGCIELAAEGSARATVTFDPKGDTLAIAARVADGDDVAYRLRPEENAVEAMQTAARLGFFAGLEWASRTSGHQARAAAPLQNYFVALGTEDDGAKLDLCVASHPDPNVAFAEISLFRGTEGASIELDSMKAESEVDLLGCAFDLGRIYERTQVSHEPDVVAVEALQPGESWTKVLANAVEEHGGGFGNRSLRVNAWRDFHGQVELRLEELTVDGWEAVRPFFEGTDYETPGAKGEHEPIRIADVLGAYLTIAAHRRAELRDERGDANPPTRVAGEAA